MLYKFNQLSEEARRRITHDRMLDLLESLQEDSKKFEEKIKSIFPFLNPKLIRNERKFPDYFYKININKEEVQEYYPEFFGKINKGIEFNIEGNFFNKTIEILEEKPESEDFNRFIQERKNSIFSYFQEIADDIELKSKKEQEEYLEELMQEIYYDNGYPFKGSGEAVDYLSSLDIESRIINYKVLIQRFDNAEKKILEKDKEFSLYVLKNQGDFSYLLEKYPNLFDKNINQKTLQEQISNVKKKSSNILDLEDPSDEVIITAAKKNPKILEDLKFKNLPESLQKEILFHCPKAYPYIQNKSEELEKYREELISSSKLFYSDRKTLFNEKKQNKEYIRFFLDNQGLFDKAIQKFKIKRLGSSKDIELDNVFMKELRENVLNNKSYKESAERIGLSEGRYSQKIKDFFSCFHETMKDLKDENFNPLDFLSPKEFRRELSDCGFDEYIQDFFKNPKTEELENLNFKIIQITNLAEETQRPEIKDIVDKISGVLRELSSILDKQNNQEDLASLSDDLQSRYNSLWQDLSYIY